MRYLFLILLILLSPLAQAQLIHTVELTKQLEGGSESDAKAELLHTAVLNSIEKYASELGFQYPAFSEKLLVKFNESFEAYKQRKLAEKFGADYKKTLTASEKEAVLSNIEKERHESFVRFSRTNSLMQSHKFLSLTNDPKNLLQWSAKIQVDLDKLKLERFFRKIVNDESKVYSRIYLVSEIDPLQFDWKDLSLSDEQGFLKPLNDSWLKWMNEKIPTTVDEIVVCDVNCMSFYSLWTETLASNLTIPEEFHQSLFLKVNLHLRRTNVIASLNETSFEWEGRALLQDISSKRVLSSMSLPQESRSFRQMDQKTLNSGLASSLYRTLIPAFMEFNRNLEEKTGLKNAQSRSAKLVIQGYKNLGDVVALTELLKTRGGSLGIEVTLGSFTKDQANVVCFYHGEEKSFTDFLSAIKELKSSHRYVLVNEFTGVHHLIKFVTE